MSNSLATIKEVSSHLEKNYPGKFKVIPVGVGYEIHDIKSKRPLSIKPSQLSGKWEDFLTSEIDEFLRING